MPSKIHLDVVDVFNQSNRLRSNMLLQQCRYNVGCQLIVLGWEYHMTVTWLVLQFPKAMLQGENSVFKFIHLGEHLQKTWSFYCTKSCLSIAGCTHIAGYSSTQETLTATRLQFSQLSTIVVICGHSFFLLLMHWSPQVCPPVKQKCLWFLQHERIPVVYEAWYPPNLLKVTSLTLGPFGKV